MDNNKSTSIPLTKRLHRDKQQMKAHFQNKINQENNKKAYKETYT